MSVGVRVILYVTGVTGLYGKPRPFHFRSRAANPPIHQPTNHTSPRCRGVVSAPKAADPPGAGAGAEEVAAFEGALERASGVAKPVAPAAKGPKGPKAKRSREDPDPAGPEVCGGVRGDEPGIWTPATWAQKKRGCPGNAFTFSHTLGASIVLDGCSHTIIDGCYRDTPATEFVFCL